MSTGYFSMAFAWGNRPLQPLVEDYSLTSAPSFRKHWLQNNVDRLSRTFHRPVVGVHNRTSVCSSFFFLLFLVSFFICSLNEVALTKCDNH